MTAPDRLELLESFVQIADTGGLSAAARAQGLTQPSVSRRLKALETAMGARLVHRTTHHVELTDEGRRLLPLARQLIAGWDAATDELSGGEAKGLLRVAAPVGLGQARLVDEAALFIKRHPKVRIDWLLTDQEVDVVSGAADLWIKVGSVRDDRLIVRPLMKAHRVLVASPKLMKTTSDWTTLPAVALSPFYGAEMDLYTKRGKRVRHQAEVVFSSDNIAAVKRAAILGMGLALLPDWLVADDLKKRALVCVAPELSGARLNIVAAYAPERGRPLRLRLFVEQLTHNLVSAS